MATQTLNLVNQLQSTESLQATVKILLDAQQNIQQHAQVLTPEQVQLKKTLTAKPEILLRFQEKAQLASLLSFEEKLERELQRETERVALEEKVKKYYFENTFPKMMAFRLKRLQCENPKVYEFLKAIATKGKYVDRHYPNGSVFSFRSILIIDRETTKKYGQIERQVWISPYQGTQQTCNPLELRENDTISLSTSAQGMNVTNQMVPVLARYGRCQGESEDITPNEWSTQEFFCLSLDQLRQVLKSEIL